MTNETMNALQCLGYPKNEARVLAALYENDGSLTASQIVEQTGIHQPSLSTLTKKLTNYPFVVIDHGESAGKGRPPYLYSVKRGEFKKHLQGQLRDLRTTLIA